MVAGRQVRTTGRQGKLVGEASRACGFYSMVALAHYGLTLRMWWLKLEQRRHQWH